jgi:hypothetical protein
LISLVTASVGCDFIGIKKREKSSTVRAVLTALNYDFSLSSSLTYSAFAILNDTSAHLFRLSKHLDLEPELVEKVSKSQDDLEYTLNLKENYFSARGEQIKAEDVEFSIKYLLAKHRDLAGPLTQISGAEKCKSENCRLNGIEILDSKTLRIRLAFPDRRFIDKLSSPWIIMLKKGRKPLEKIGECLIPYQTGAFEVIECIKDKKIVLKGYGNQIEVGTSLSGTQLSAELLTTNLSGRPSPTLTILTAFANPSSNLNENVRKKITGDFRRASAAIAESVNLKHSTTIASSWIGLPLFKQGNQMTNNTQCPSRPIKVLLDSSLPDHALLKKAIESGTKCELSFESTTSDKYFEAFARNDIGLAWFTPDFIDLPSFYSQFDCSVGSPCYFSWLDPALQYAIDRLKQSSSKGLQDKSLALEIERLLAQKGYAVPIAEMNWWLRHKQKTSPIHPAGLFQLRISDFIDVVRD